MYGPGSRVSERSSCGVPTFCASIAARAAANPGANRRLNPTCRTIFLETLIHDFDTLCFLNPGARPVRVHAVADALVRPDAKSSGHLDTAVVTVQFDNGAIATAEASFSALYGYDVRAEVFGSGGMITAGSGLSTDMTYYGPDGLHADTARRDTDLLHSAYVGELTAFVDAIRTHTPAVVTGHDARTALSIALAAVRSVETGSAVDLDR